MKQKILKLSLLAGTTAVVMLSSFTGTNASDDLQQALINDGKIFW